MTFSEKLLADDVGDGGLEGPTLTPVVRRNGAGETAFRAKAPAT
jgi:hypothetical protein